MNMQVPALLLATVAAVCKDPARENLKIATVTVYAISSMTAVAIICVLHQCSITHKV